MKKLILIASFLLVGMVSVSHADQAKFKVPVSVNNIADPLLQSAGVEKSQVISSTIPALATDRNGTTFTDGLIYWVIVPATASATTAFLEFRDTATANTSSTHLISNIAPILNTANGEQIRIFNPPVPFYNGLSLNLLPLGAAPAAGSEFTVGIRSKRQ